MRIFFIQLISIIILYVGFANGLGIKPCCCHTANIQNSTFSEEINETFHVESEEECRALCGISSPHSPVFRWVEFGAVCPTG